MARANAGNYYFVCVIVKVVSDPNDRRRRYFKVIPHLITRVKAKANAVANVGQIAFAWRSRSSINSKGPVRMIQMTIACERNWKNNGTWV